MGVAVIHPIDCEELWYHLPKWGREWRVLDNVNDDDKKEEIGLWGSNDNNKNSDDDDDENGIWEEEM